MNLCDFLVLFVSFLLLAFPDIVLLQMIAAQGLPLRGCDPAPVYESFPEGFSVLSQQLARKTVEHVCGVVSIS